MLVALARLCVAPGNGGGGPGGGGGGGSGITYFTVGDPQYIPDSDGALAEQTFYYQVWGE